MAIQEKRYLDFEGLQSFFDNLKTYYLNENVKTVGYAEKANKLATPVNVSFTFENQALGLLENFDGSSSGTVELDLSDFAKKGEIAGAIDFKGVVDHKDQLPDPEDADETKRPKNGDIYIVKYKGPTPPEGEEDDQVALNAEYIFVGDEGKWEEFGNTAVLEGYVKVQAFEEFQDEVDAVAAQLQSDIDAEVAAREAGDLEVYNSILSIEDYRIRKLFHGVTAGNAEALATNIADAPNGSVISLTSDVTVDHLMAVAPGKELTLEVPAGKTLTVDTERLFSVGENNGQRATLELVGEGTIEMAQSDTNDEPLIFVRGGNTLIVDGPTFINHNPENSCIIQTNGKQSGVDIVIKSGTFDGSLYLPAGGTTTIEGGEFYYGTQVLYCKSGTLNISGGKFNVTSVPDATDGNWAHWNNGNVDMGSTIVIEACNYGGRGNPVVNITGGEFKVAEPSDIDYKNYPILVIHYNGNTADMAGTTVPYQLADNVTGHVTVDGKSAPTDGWLKFNDSNTTLVE